MQPIVVKKKNEKLYELIDGQQRLTTVYLILHYLNQDFVETKRDKLFDMNYKTRSGSKDFLQHPEEDADENIDFYHIHQAYCTIESWFENKNSKVDFDRNAFRSKLKFHTKVIWYEISEEDPITVFTRLNVGK